MDETKLDQISIPPLCRHLSEMAHTLVGKAVPLKLNAPWFNSRGLQNRHLGRITDTMEICLCFFVFFVL